MSDKLSEGVPSTMNNIEITNTFTPEQYNPCYCSSSVFNEPQHLNFTNALQASLDYLIKLCIEVPHQIKKIVYLADDILELAKSIPSYIRSSDVIDMRIHCCSVVRELANLAPKVEVGLPVNIDKQLATIQNLHG